MSELKKLMQEVNAFSEERDWDQFHKSGQSCKIHSYRSS